MCKQSDREERLSVDLLIKNIQAATDYELQDIMKAIEKRYSTAYPDWDVVYVAVPKDPKIRREKLENILKWFDKDLQWYTEKAEKAALK